MRMTPQGRALLRQLSLALGISQVAVVEVALRSMAKDNTAELAEYKRDAES